MDVWSPAWLVLAGIAGGVSGAVDGMRLGDVLVPDQVVGYELAKMTPGHTCRRYEVYRPDKEMLACARSLGRAGWTDLISAVRPDDADGRVRPLMHVGPMLTGDKVLADPAALAGLRQDWPKAIGVEMESLGVALVGYQNGAGFLIVKAVSDFADIAKNDSWHRYAAEAAARFTVAVLTGASAIAADRDPGRVRQDGASEPRPQPSAAGPSPPSRSASAPSPGVRNEFYAPVEAGVIGISYAAEPRSKP